MYRNGIIRYYTATVINIESGIAMNISTNSSSLTVQELHPYYQYEARVKAMTVLYGPYSTEVTVQLDEDGKGLI